MKYLSILLLSFFLFSCTNKISLDEWKELCPYEHRYGSGAHYIVVPIDMIPNQQYYKLGDTLTIRMNHSDTIYDLAKDVYFNILDFPFEPVNLLYRIEEDSWHSGYRDNELIVDEKYMPRFNSQVNFSNDMRGHTIYQNGRYDFEYKLVFETPGNYCTYITDQYVANVGVFADVENAEQDAIDFEGKCPGAEFFMCHIVNGNTYIDKYQDELVYLDTTVFRDNLGRPDGIDRAIYGSGSVAIDWRGMYCFTVE